MYCIVIKSHLTVSCILFVSLDTISYSVSKSYNKFDSCTAMTSRFKRSEVWEYFNQDYFAFAASNACSDEVKRGKEDNKASWSACPLWYHLRRHHT